MGDRIGRNGRVLGKRSSVLDQLDENVKKRVLESSGINDDGIDEEERDSIVRAILESNPDLLKEEQGKLQNSSNSTDSNKSSPGDTSGLNQQPTLSVEDDDATQPPCEMEVELDSTSKRQNREQQEMGADSDIAVQNDSQDSPPLMQTMVEPQAVAKSTSLRPQTNSSQSDRDKEDYGMAKAVPAFGGEKTQPGSSADAERSGDEDETQFYDVHNDQIVQETQRSEVLPTRACSEGSEPAIPDSLDDSDSKSEDGGLLSSRNSRSDKNDHSRHSTLKSTLNSSNPASFLQTLNPLWPVLHCKDSGLDKDCCSQVVKLMFELYMRRVCREQKRLAQRLAWGDPVETGRHVEGCLRCKRGSKNVQFTPEACSLKKSILMRHGRAGHSEEVKEDVVDNEDYNDDDDFESHTSGLRLSSWNKSSTRTEHGAYDLTLEDTSRRSTRLSATKARQRQLELAMFSNSDESDEEEWSSNQTKTKRKRQTTKRKTLKQEQTNLGQGNNLDAKQKLQKLGYVSETADKPLESLSIGETRRTRRERKEVCEGNSGVDKQSVLEEKDPDVDTKSSPSNFIYKFNSESDEDSNECGSKPYTKEAENSSRGVSVRGHERVTETVIELSDSDQSTGRAEPNSHDQKSSQKQDHSAFTTNTKLCATREVSCVTESGTHGDSATEVKETGEIPPDLCDSADETASEDSETMMKDSLAPASNLNVCVSIGESCSPEELPVLIDVGDASSRDSVTSFSQSSNSLLDQQGQIFSTQIKRSSRSFCEGSSNKSKDKLRLRASKSNPPCNVKGEDTLDQVMSYKVQVAGRKRKAVERCEESHPKRLLPSGKAHEGSDPEDVECAVEREEEETSEVVLVRKTRRRKLQQSVILSDTKKKQLAVQPRIILSKSEEAVAEDESNKGMAEPVPVDDVSIEEKTQTTVEEDLSCKMVENLTANAGLGNDEEIEQQQDQANQPAASIEDDQPQRSFLEDLTCEVDEQALSTCPICNKEFTLILIEAHASTCGEEMLNPEQEEPDPRCAYCGEIVTRARLREHQRLCEMEQLAGTSSHGRVTRSKRGDQHLH